jgi:hypothetical protein
MHQFLKFIFSRIQKFEKLVHAVGFTVENGRKMLLGRERRKWGDNIEVYLRREL